MMNELLATPGWPLTAYWLGLALVLAILEIVVPTFFFLFMSAAALLGVAAAFAGLALELQLVVFGVGILLSMLLVRPRLLARMHTRQEMPSRTEALHGKLGKVTTAIEALSGHGRVLVEGQDWAASSTESLAVNTEVVVTGADGIVLHVNRP